MKKYIFTYIFVVATAIVHIHSQTLEDALRMSMIDPIGSARTLGVSNVFGSMGADQGSIYFNPAGLANFYKSEFSISPMANIVKSTGTLNNSSYRDFAAVNFDALNMGLVFVGNNSNFSMNLNTINNYNRNIYYTGLTEGSIVQRFAERANGKPESALDPFEALLAYETGAIIKGKENNYETDYLEGQELQKYQRINSTGSMREFSLNWAKKFKDKVQVGIALGIPFLTYNESKSYNEEAIDNKSPFRSLTYRESQRSRAVGVNMKLGMILKPYKSFRVGASIQSPTLFSIDDEYSTSMSYTYETTVEESYMSSSPEGFFDYKFRTPWRTSLSIGYLYVGKKINGFVAGEIDYFTYKYGFFNLTSDVDLDEYYKLQNELNTDVQLQFSNNLNFKLGGEIAYDIYRARLGFQLLGSPFELDKNKMLPSSTIGFGLRFDKFFFDLAMRWDKFEYGYSPYKLLDSNQNQLVNVKNNKKDIVFSLGFMF